MKRLLPIAIALEALKFLVLILAANHLPETRNEFLNAVAAISFWILMLPEMLVSYEQGPHGILARIVMFTAGTIANLGLIGIILSIWGRRTQNG